MVTKREGKSDDLPIRWIIQLNAGKGYEVPNRKHKFALTELEHTTRHWS